METTSYVLVIPLFLAFIGAEWWFSRLKKMSVYRLDDTLSNLYCGIGQLAVDIMWLYVLIVVYRFFWNLAPYHIEFNIWSSLVLIVFVDFLAYWFHRASHTNAFLWSIHAVHHQSQEFNFSVGIRLPWFHKFVAIVIYLPPAFLGFDYKQYLLVGFVHATLQTFSHTRLFTGDWKILKNILVMPIHHRIHHSREEQHLNRNFANVFSIWDRLFDTHMYDPKEPLYGIGEGRASLNPWKSQSAPMTLSKYKEQLTGRTINRVLLLTVTAIGLYSWWALLPHENNFFISLAFFLGILAVVIFSGVMLEKELKEH